MLPIIHRFISLDMEMDEMNFVSMHQAVVDTVVSRGVFTEIIGKLKLSSFAKKAIVPTVEEDIPDQEVPVEASTSQKVTGTKPKAKRKPTGKGRGKSKGQKVVSREQVPFVQTVGKADMTTQTDSDFEEYLHLSEEDFNEYQMYKEKQMMQQYLVSTIQEKDFHDYEAE